MAYDWELSPGVRSLYPEGYPPHFTDQVAFPALSQIVVGIIIIIIITINMIVIWTVRIWSFPVLYSGAWGSVVVKALRY